MKVHLLVQQVAEALQWLQTIAIAVNIAIVMLHCLLPGS